MEKIDFKKVFKKYYSPKPGKPEIVTPPSMDFLMIDGKGDPNGSEEFQNAVSALYGIVYGLKFGRKKTGLGPDFGVGPLEGLWWTNGKNYEMGRKQDWFWTIML